MRTGYKNVYTSTILDLFADAFGELKELKEFEIFSTANVLEFFDKWLNNMKGLRSLKAHVAETKFDISVLPKIFTSLGKLKDLEVVDLD